MSVVQTTVSRAKPGRRQEVAALALEAAKLFERHGAGESRLLVAGVAGETTGTYVFTTEFANGEAWGACTDALNADAETAALLDRVYSDPSPIVLESMSIGVDIPLGRAAAEGHGSVIEAYVSRDCPGASMPRSSSRVSRSTSSSRTARSRAGSCNSTTRG